MATNEKFLPTCNPNLTPMAASGSNGFTPRRAVDPSGRLGSLYDACRDQVLQNSTINFTKQSVQSRQLPRCSIKQYDTAKAPYLLYFIHMHDELHLSIALDMTVAKGVGALVDYSRPIDKYTRFIIYSYYSRTDYVSDDELKLANKNRPSIRDGLATHVIVLVNWGIDATVVLQLPPDDELIQAIDYTIGKLCIFLSEDHTTSEFPQEDIKCLKKILRTEVFSNISDLSKTNSLIDFYHDIRQVKNDNSLHKPYNYNLCPIQYFYHLANEKQVIFKELQAEQLQNIKLYLLYLSGELKKFRTAMDQDYCNLQQHRKHQLYDVQTKWSNLQQMYSHEIKRLRTLVIDIRRGKIDQNDVLQALNSDKKEESTITISQFEHDLNIMQQKERLIKGLLEKKFEYQNATDRGVTKDDDKLTLKRRLLTDEKCQRIICSDDTVYKNNKSQWYAINTQLLKEREGNPRLKLIYCDFSDCSYTLHRFLVFPTTQTNNDEDVPTSKTSLSERVKNDDIMNILLIGETGAGKSTFINAFVNYLHFDKLEQAKKKPVVLIPVSFVITSGDDFEEHEVKFGGIDTLSNEDYGYADQSVTQHCKSYLFTLPDSDNSGQKLRVIDTPGIGDTRGLAQDDINMQHILSYINNLTHLNAVCILMKPNNSQLNIFFRSCLMQLFDLLGDDAHNKIIFCFTNTRATFYSPGNTAPLLKTLLESIPGKQIPFIKANTFCFDNVSFRYLPAIQYGIRLSNSQENKCKFSWDRSSKEAKRFLKYLRTKMTIPLDSNERKSIKDAQLKISLMIRPMLETMRNLLRNIALLDKGSRAISIELCPGVINNTTAICLTCPRLTLQLDDFWITTDGLHVFRNHCRTCACDSNEHYPIHYELGYKISRVVAGNSDKDMTKTLNDLCEASAEFGHFVFGEMDTSQKDLFLLGFDRILKEEGDICAKKKPCQLNKNLLKQLQVWKNSYEDMKQKMATKKKRSDVSVIYDKIETISNHPIIKSQMLAVKEWQKYMIKYYEYEVPI